MKTDSRKMVIKISHPIFSSLMVGFYFLSVIRVAAGINLPVYLYLFFTAVICLLCTPVEIVSFMCSLVAFSGSFQYRYALLISMIALLAKRGIKKTNIRNVAPVLFMMVWELTHAAMSNLTLYGFLQEFSELLALTILLIDDPLDYSDGVPIRMFAYSSLFSCFMNLIASTNVLGFSIHSLTRLGKVGADIADFQSLIDPNTMGFICVISICSLLLVSYKGREKRSDKFIMLALFVFILLSQSKSALASIFIVFVLYFFLSEKRMVLSKKRIFRACFTAIIALLICFAFNNVVSAFFNRFKMGDISNGRIAIFAFYNMHLFYNMKNILFGIGLFDYNIQITNIYEDLWMSYSGLAASRGDSIIYKPSHNNIQEILVVWGIVGIILVVFLIVRMIKHYPGKKEIVNYVPLLILFIYGLQGEFLSSGVALMTLMFSQTCLEYLPIKRTIKKIKQTG